MRVLIVGQNHDYADLVRGTETGTRCHVEIAGYQDALERITSEMTILVEATVGDPTGLAVARQILHRYPGITLVFLMKECQFEYSMAAMRMGAKNILVDEEINAASLEQILQQEAASATQVDRQTIVRNFEKMIFFHSGGPEQAHCAQVLNRAFDLEQGGRHFIMMIATSLDFVREQVRLESVTKKIRSEAIRERLLQLSLPGVNVPFVFYVDQLFYFVVLCDAGNAEADQRTQLQGLLDRLCVGCTDFLGQKLILLSSRQKSDFQQLPECLDELDALQNVMHCGSYPCKMSIYSMPWCHGQVQQMDELLQQGQAAVRAITEGGEYEAMIRTLFAQETMTRITFSQFMKLKERIFFDLQSAYKQLEAGISDRAQLEELLEQLPLYCNYPYAQELILDIACRLASAAGKRYHHLVSKCIRLVAEQYRSDISLQEMADTLNISNVYLSSLFRRETGKKFSSYVNEYRLTKARELIDSGDQPLSQVYEMVGFTNQQYFSNCFKKAYGMTPSEYKNKKR